MIMIGNQADTSLAIIVWLVMNHVDSLGEQQSIGHDKDPSVKIGWKLNCSSVPDQNQANAEEI
jgi:hypothetical protein